MTFLPLKFTAFQIIFIVFCSFQLGWTLLRLGKTRQMVDLVFAVDWAVDLFLLIDPKISSKIAEVLGIGRGADLVLYFLCFGFLYAHYQHYLRYKRTEAHITTLVRELAIERARPR